MSGGEAPPPSNGAPEWSEVRLSDLLRTVYRRRAILVTCLLVGGLAAVAATVMTDPAYEASAAIVPLEQKDLVQQWLESRQAAERAVQRLGPRVYDEIAPGQWDAGRQAWIGAPPSSEGLGTALMGHVTITKGAPVRIRATMGDPVAARDVAQAYLDTLADLRKDLENITRNEMFVKFYDGSNAQDAQRQAEEVARQRVYWLVLDTPLLPQSAVQPRPSVNLALGLAGGLMLGLLGVFGAEWLSGYRADLRGRPELATPPPEPFPEPPRGDGSPQPGNGAPKPADGGTFTVVKRGPAEPAQDPVVRFWVKR